MTAEVTVKTKKKAATIYKVTSERILNSLTQLSQIEGLNNFPRKKGLPLKKVILKVQHLKVQVLSTHASSTVLLIAVHSI
jgi:hypothetical protein